MVLGTWRGRDPIVWPEQVHEWYEAEASGDQPVPLRRGAATRTGRARASDGGLMPPGPALLREMDKLGMILDVSHTSDESVRQELDIFEGPVLAESPELPVNDAGRAAVPRRSDQEDHREGGRYRPLYGHLHALTKEVDWANIPPRRPFSKDDGHAGAHRRQHRPRGPAGRQYRCTRLSAGIRTARAGPSESRRGRYHHDLPQIADLMAQPRLLGRMTSRQHMWKNWDRFFEAHLPGD